MKSPASRSESHDLEIIEVTSIEPAVSGNQLLGLDLGVSANEKITQNVLS
jgi:hypothetical protein